MYHISLAKITRVVIKRRKVHVPAQENLAHLMASATRLANAVKVSKTLIPEFLCPTLASSIRSSHSGRRRNVRIQKRQFHVETVVAPTCDLPTPSQLLELPKSCPGCGAFTQIVSPDQPGFYSTNRKSVKAFIARHGQVLGKGQAGESETFHRVLGSANPALLSRLGLASANPPTDSTNL